MTTRTVNLDTYSLSLLTAKEDILNPRSSTNWALFTYDGVSNKLKLADSGVGGVAELAGKFHISKPQYGLCRVGTAETGGPRIAMISWVGQNVDDYRRTECASHMPAIKNFFKEVHVFISAEKVDEVTEEKIAAELSKAAARAPVDRVRRSSRSVEKEETVGTNYRKTNAALEMRRINRDSFWARAEREEEERKEEERRRAAEERRRLERERVMKERREAEERDRKMNEKLQMIEEQRRKQAEKEEELRRQERLRWEQQQREHEEDMRARLRRSESIEKAAEAAALVSQRSMNPREFFRQLSSSSQSPTSPGSGRTGKPPFRRYQRSLTDTAFIFQKSEDSTSTSPRSPPLVSPFSRAPPSPFYRTTSPPTSPSFRPITSPQRPRAPMITPPSSPVRSAPPVSSLPGLNLINHQAHAPVKPRSPSPTEPSAPPASPSLLASFSSSLPQDHPAEPQPEALPPSPPVTPPQGRAQTQTQTASRSPQDTPIPEPEPVPQAPTAPLPVSPQPITDLYKATELVSDTGYSVKAVLVEEDEEEDEEKEEEKPEEPQSEPRTVAAEPARAFEEQEEEQEEEEEDEQEERGSKEEAEPASLEERVETALEEEEEEAEDIEQQNDHTDYSQALTQPAATELFEEEEEEEEEEESAVTDGKAICQQIKQEAAVPATNGITNEENIRKQNGIERSLSPSDTELSNSELAVCYDLHGTVKEVEEEEEEEEDEEDAEDQGEEIPENGQMATPERQMCVRALYDYQAEDETEISFEPGDIISDVETIDKAWWRGCSKDGRQGLFPANYVETI
ncbi:drebrin-like protein [Myripristis murdjan]|uniref:drebrin-like protein n=1 Tax=Myripristis murdjan TaxID=586833 RepID=UPI001175E81A|nr:drebrin-like protein [Myripristis murdjan]